MGMNYESMLTRGSLKAIMNNEEIKEPVMQVLGSRKIAASGADERYRLLISDGLNHNSFALLASQLNGMVSSGELSDFAIIKIKRHIISNVTDRTKSNKQVLLLLDVSVMVKGNLVGAKIGDPKPIVDGQDTNKKVSQVVDGQDNSKKVSPNGYERSVQSSIANNDNNIHPINSLSPYQNKWTIRARIMSKSSIRTWTNQRGDGKLFSMDLVDEHGEIRATAFNSECDKFYDMIEVNKVYFITKGIGIVKTANKKYTNLNNDYELTLNGETQIFPCHDFDDTQMPTMKFNFVSLNVVKDLDTDSMVDVIGVCQHASDVVNLVSKTTKKELKKRDITLVDQSLSSVTVTLWDNLAEEFDGSLQPVVAIKGSKIREFMGSKSLSLMGSTLMQINPDIEDSHRLRGWYDALPSTVEFNSISTRSESGTNSQFHTIKSAQIAQLGSGDKADYYSMYSYLVFIKGDSALYKACPKADCQKKVIDRNDGTYRCEKCNDESENFKYRLLLQAQLCDTTGSQWVTMFQEAGEGLLGINTSELGKFYDDDKEEYNNIIHKKMFKMFETRVRAKLETYNNETRLKVSVMNMKPVDFKLASSKLIADIKRLSGIGTSTM
ncbi:replication protein A 70 kDa DNA-binding subunit-like [Daktulosphaira vitifoliae]|uniref:replication protein A 70 kDa DNA-binding subunit-like n=1 Tax=Daktulosphaira vitifoliae TaxID=58002 RepID=UPI0021AB01E6|nr:replication protein A 70 kDa DNA-binding subunit-like [Daktulosphaira vitifoliae]